MTPFQLYLILKLDDIKAFFCVSATILLVASVMAFAYWMENGGGGDGSEKKAIKISLVTFILSVLLFLIVVLTPSTKQMVTIIVTPKVINNRKVQGMPQKLLDVLDIKLDKLLKVDK